MSRVVRTCVALAACASLTACGVQEQDRARLVPSAEIPPGLLPSAAASTRPRAAEVTLYVVDRGRLVPQRAPAERADAEGALLVLLTHDTLGAGRSAVPAATEIRAVRVQGGVLTADLSEPFGLVRGPDQLVAVAQVVWTVTEFPDVDRVLLRVEGEPLDLPVGGGAVSGDPVGRADYRVVGPADEAG